MKKIFDSVNEQCTVYDAIYDCLNKQKSEDRKNVKEKYSGGLTEEKIDQVEHDYDINIDKLNYIPDLTFMDEAFQKKFTQVALYIDYMDLDLGRKLDAILSFAALINNAPEQVEMLENEKCYLLSTAMSSLPVSDYQAYGTLLTNENLLDSIIEKTDNMNERRKIVYDLFDYCDDFVYDDMSKDELNIAISNCNNFIDNYKVLKENKYYKQAV